MVFFEVLMLVLIIGKKFFKLGCFIKRLLYLISDWCVFDIYKICYRGIYVFWLGCCVFCYDDM